MDEETYTAYDFYDEMYKILAMEEELNETLNKLDVSINKITDNDV